MITMFENKRVKGSPMLVAAHNADWEQESLEKIKKSDQYKSRNTAIIDAVTLLINESLYSHGRSRGTEPPVKDALKCMQYARMKFNYALNKKA